MKNRPKFDRQFFTLVRTSGTEQKVMKKYRYMAAAQKALLHWVRVAEMAKFSPDKDYTYQIVPEHKEQVTTEV